MKKIILLALAVLMMVGCMKTKEDGEPIPLTQEILEKNGFVPSDEWKSLYYLNDGEDEFAFEINNAYQIWWSKECGNVMIAQLEYVHTLQHALKLCGIEKEIEL